jgi:hypothetical protein
MGKRLPGLTVNGRAREDAVAANLPLVEYPRTTVGLTGTNSRAIVLERATR